MPGPLLAVFDGNSLLHRAYHAAATGKVLDREGRPVWAVKGLVTHVARAAALVRPDAVLIGFDCPDSSVRKADYPAYKGQRPDKPADLVSQLLLAPDALAAAGFSAVRHPSYEADDVLASAAAAARRAGWRSVVVTSDRDAYALIDETTSVLSIRNGGLEQAILMDAAGLARTVGVSPGQYRDFAALRGDPSDNLEGVRGFGAATAARLLAAYGSIEEAWAALDGAGAAAVRALVGEGPAEHLRTSRAVVDRNRRLMRMYADLPVPDLETTRLPLDYALVRASLAERGIFLGPSLWALTGRTPPVPEIELPLPRARTVRALREPCSGQLTLF